MQTQTTTTDDDQLNVFFDKITDANRGVIYSSAQRMHDNHEEPFFFLSIDNRIINNYTPVRSKETEAIQLKGSDFLKKHFTDSRLWPTYLQGK